METILLVVTIGVMVAFVSAVIMLMYAHIRKDIGITESKFMVDEFMPKFANCMKDVMVDSFRELKKLEDE